MSQLYLISCLSLLLRVKDAARWEEELGGFDEQTTDDYDVDMALYEGFGACTAYTICTHAIIIVPLLPHCM